MGRLGIRTVSQLLGERAAEVPYALALRESAANGWTELTWNDVDQEVSSIAKRLLAQGISQGDRVAIAAPNRIEWFLCDIAINRVGAVTVGVFTSLSHNDLQHVLTHSGARLLFASADQVNKLSGLPPNAVDTLESVICFDEAPCEGLPGMSFATWATFLAAGEKDESDTGEALTEPTFPQPDLDALATIIYTSGTTDTPKGVMLSNRNVGFVAFLLESERGAYPGRLGHTMHDRVVSYLPLAHVAERAASVWASLVSGMSLTFVADIEDLPATMQDVQPTMFIGVPRVWERIERAIEDTAASARGVAGPALERLPSLIRHIGRLRFENGGDVPVRYKPMLWLLRRTVLTAVLKRIGLSECRRAAVGAAPMRPELIIFFMGLGIEINELYGLTESGGVGTTNMPGRVRPGTVGEPYRATDVRIDPETSEIQLLHDALFVGYWRDEDATEAAFTPDGWLRTGDLGEWVGNSHLRVLGRSKDVMVLPSGLKVAPTKVEGALLASPLIDEAVVVGDGREFIGALIRVGDRSGLNPIPDPPNRSFPSPVDADIAVATEIDAINESLAPHERVRAFRTLPRDLSIEREELTPSRKIRRQRVIDNFAELVDSMYL